MHCYGLGNFSYLFLMCPITIDYNAVYKQYARKSVNIACYDIIKQQMHRKLAADYVNPAYIVHP